MSTTTPDTIQQLLEMNQKEEMTPEKVLENFLELNYDEQDNFLFHLLQGSLKFHQFLLKKSQDGDEGLPDTDRLLIDCVKLEQIVELYSQVQ